MPGPTPPPVTTEVGVRRSPEHEKIEVGEVSQQKHVMRGPEGFDKPLLFWPGSLEAFGARVSGAKHCFPQTSCGGTQSHKPLSTCALHTLHAGDSLPRMQQAQSLHAVQLKYYKEQTPKQNALHVLLEHIQNSYGDCVHWFATSLSHLRRLAEFEALALHSSKRT